MNSFYLGPWLVEPPLNRLRKNGTAVQLEPKIMQVLLRLAEAPGEVLSKDELIKAVWADTFVTDDVLTRSISELRKVLQDDPKQPKFIETISRAGYRLIAAVTQLPGAAGGFGAAAGAQPAPETLVTEQRGVSWGRLTVIGAITALLLAGSVLLLRRGKPPVSGRVTVVILPFQSFSNNPEQEAFSDGLTDDLITELARTDPEHMAVIARTSAMSYKNKAAKISDIARDLRADYVLEGSARRDGETVRITAQLIQAKDQTHIWARHYDRPLRDVLDLQQEMARAIAVEIRVNVPAARPAPAAIPPEAYLAYLNGRYNWNQRSEPALIKAISYFRQAIALYPGYAAAYSGLADCYASLAYGGFLAPSESFPIAREAALKALQLEPDLAEPHTSLGYVHLYYDWDFSAAEEEFRKALNADPRYVQAHDWYASYLTAMGRWNEAKDQLDQALELDPISVPVRTDMGFELYYSGQYDDAQRVLEAIVHTTPKFGLAHFWLARNYQAQKNFKAGAAEFAACLDSIQDWPAAVGSLGNLYALAGHKQQARETLGRLQALSAHHYVSPYVVALIYAGLNERDAAFRTLDEAVKQRTHWLVWVSNDPRWSNLWSDPRFLELLRRVGLPATPRAPVPAAVTLSPASSHSAARRASPPARAGL